MPRCELTEVHQDLAGPDGLCGGVIVQGCDRSARVVLVLKHEPRKARTVWRVCWEHLDEVVDDLVHGRDPGTEIGKVLPLSARWSRA